LTFQANPFVVPAPPAAGSLNRLAARFSMMGAFTGYPDSNFGSSMPNFSITLHGAGGVDFSGTRFRRTRISRRVVAVKYSPLPDEPGWTGVDIGKVRLPGNDGFVDLGTSSMEVGGAGSDIWGVNDAFWKRRRVGRRFHRQCGRR